MPIRSSVTICARRVILAAWCAAAPSWAEEPHPAAASRAAEARRLGYAGGKDAIGRLVQVLKTDPDESVREAAAWAIGKIGHRGDAEVLRDAIERDASPMVRNAAMRSILQVSARPEPTSPVILVAAATSARTRPDPGPSPNTALHLALGTTFGGITAGLALAATGAGGEGAVLAAASLTLGPSLGHFYSGEVLHGVGMSAARGALMLGAVGLLVVGAFQCVGDSEESCQASDVPFVFAGVFAVGALTLAGYDIVDAPRAARRARAARRSLSIAPALRPDGGAAAVLSGTF